MSLIDDKKYSLETEFLHSDNIKLLSNKLKRNVEKEMIGYAWHKRLDDSEHLYLGYEEVVRFVNNDFIKSHTFNIPEMTSIGNGEKKYPKVKVDGGVGGYNVNDFRTMDAQFTDSIQRSNKNFRYGNKIRKWETSLYTRNYDREYHETGLRDTRELNTINRGYNMEKIYGPNEYISSNSIMYNL
jgi:hypothetical protein